MLLIPMVSVALVIEGRDLDIPFLAIECLRLLKRPICLEPEQRKKRKLRKPAAGYGRNLVGAQRRMGRFAARA